MHVSSTSTRESPSLTVGMCRILPVSNEISVKSGNASESPGDCLCRSIMATNKPQTPQQSQGQAICEHDSGVAQTTRLLARLRREKFFGKLTISFEAGNIVTLRKEQTLKPNELGG